MSKRKKNCFNIQQFGDITQITAKCHKHDIEIEDNGHEDFTETW